MFGIEERFAAPRESCYEWEEYHPLDALLRDILPSGWVPEVRKHAECFVVREDPTLAVVDDLLTNITLCTCYAFLGLLLGMFWSKMRTRWQWWSHSPIGATWSSWLIAILVHLVAQCEYRTTTLRSIFVNQVPVVNRIAKRHTHAHAASVRNNGSSFMTMFGLSTGMVPYFLQRSPADERNGRQGCRSYHWAKDLSADEVPYDPPSNACLCLVDVDMYMDIPRLLSTEFRPVIISTFQPSKVAHASTDYCYTFTENDEVDYRVAGGAAFRHKVWQYGADIVMAVDRRWGLYHHHVYNVDRRQLDEDHQLVLLTPIKRFIFPCNLSTLLKSAVIQRLRVAEKVDTEVFLRLSVMTAEGLMRSTGRPMQYACAKISAEDDDAVAALARVGKNHELTPATVRTAVKDISQTQAVVLTEYHRQKRGETTDFVFPVATSVFRYQMSPSSYDPLAKASMIPFMSPLVLGCYAPDKVKANDQAAIDGRVHSVRSPELSISSELMMYMIEFVEFLIPKPGRAVPVDVDDVFDKQGRPSQRQILHRASLQARLSVDEAMQTFMKAEAYAKASDPRIISTVPGVNKLGYSRYIYSFTQCLRNTKWYAFGRKPIETAERVAEIALTAEMLALTDLSRFDGRVSNVLRHLEHIAMLRYFGSEFHPELTELMATQKNQRAVTTYGVKYDTGLIRASGSAETADFNSMDNAFMGYAALRRTRIDGRTYTPLEAWSKLGIYGGDDGMTPDVDPDVYVKTCAEVGQVLEIDVRRRGEPGVTFLARYYSPDVWHGATDSMCDVKRQVSKLHVTTSLPPNITALQKLGEKMAAFYLTDKNTPIIGTMASFVAEHFPELIPGKLTLGIANWHAINAGRDEQYPNSESAAGWMKDQVDKDMPDFDHAKMQAWLEKASECDSAEMLLRPPLCGSLDHAHEVKVDVVINGEVKTPPKPVTSEKRPFTPEQLAKMKTQPCRDHAKGKCRFANCRFAHGA